MRIDFEVPATSANLGSGFDAVGIALELRLRASLRCDEQPFRTRFLPGPHMPTHGGFEQEIVRGMRALLGEDAELPRGELVVENPLPLGKGLGSSAAALVLGLLVADSAAGLETSAERMVALACELEGHPDNSTPALLGGVVVAAQRGTAEPSYLRFNPPQGVRAIVAVPQLELATSQARAMLPQAYAKADTVFNIQRAALLGASLASGDLRHLRVAMQDRLHQPYRAAHVPGLEDTLRLEAPGLLGVALSGAGPSVLALVEGNTMEIAAAMRECFTRNRIACETWVLGLAREGALVHDRATDERRVVGGS
ncbi:MAG TPA: homoserine kinase [Candidatus Dormibacteraeota bacterium]|nr:homoserine kinase [Candidatus Dormibacteraeota bacterium]